MISHSYPWDFAMHSKHITRRLRHLTSILPALLLAACFGEGDGPERILGTPQAPLTGLLVDARVLGVAWETSSGSTGTTDS